MSIIKDMYYGNIPSFIELNPRSENYDKIMKEILMLQDKIIKEFPDANEIFEKYFATYQESAHEFEFLQFQMGVRVGVQLMLEMMRKNTP